MDPLVQRSMVIRVLRFVSPHPWGSRTAEGFRRSAGLDRIVTSLFGNASNVPSKRRLAFSAGSHVLWTPVYVGPGGQLRHAKPVSGTEGWTKGWLASRSPPYKSANGLPGLEIDVTSSIPDEKPFTEPIEILYDNRFILSFDLCSAPDEVFERLRASLIGHRLVIAATKKYFLPRLVLRTSNGRAAEDIHMSGPTVSGTDGRSSGAGWANWRLARTLE